MVRIRAAIASLALLAACFAQNARDVKSSVRSWRATHETEIVRQFAGLLSIPNLASDTVNIRRNAEYISAELKKRSVEARLLNVTNGPPIVFGNLNTPGAQKTLIFYAHYDGQPVDPAQWATNPWKPVVRDGMLEHGGKEVPLDSLPKSIPPEWRIYARSAGDDKTPIQALLTALDALRANNLQPSVNVKFFFEGEEEAGSPHLPSAIKQYSDLLKADTWILCDGPVHQTRRMQVFFGARGETGVELTVFGPNRALHSGHYGNWAPNPAILLAELLSSMRDSNAKIKIAGFYDDVRPVTESEREAIRQMPDVDTQLKEELGLAWTEGEPEPIAMRIMAPALNVRGIESGHVGEKTQNAIPTEARVSIDFRLVPDQTPERVRELVERHIRSQGFYIVEHPPTAEERRAHARIIQAEWGPGNPPARTSMDLPISRAVVSAIEKTTGGSIIKAPTLGGTVPMYLFTDVLKTPVIGVPIANHDNNQHAANENLRIQNLWDGVEIFAGLLTGVATQ
jgi:acetylornithine deacetylase/succinyl-diaminopimelate desuccinylase-like protein